MSSVPMFLASASPAGSPQPGALSAALVTKAEAGPVTFYPTDSMIFAQGDKAGAVYLVEFGTVRICRVTNDGRRQINSFHFAGDVFGFEAGEERQCSAESVDGAGIRVVHTDASGVPPHRLLRLALASFADAQHHLLRLGRMNAVEKLASFLLDLLDRQESDSVVALQMQRCDIADYLGLTFETVSRVLRSLKDGGIIKVPSIDRIEIVDAAALAALSD
ncbi:helix-turn-helix domain-containing protein [Devosia sp. A16]|uniref:helix-turn-helix domain-containing protein n=1 Tax=Devosia sp. A16 TaxID=1736675 RepID=UPI0006D80AC4|nr:helix-turn-helix domain-containing protein [Devosia sp. A16]